MKTPSSLADLTRSIQGSIGGKTVVQRALGRLKTISLVLATLIVILFATAQVCMLSNSASI
jgi:hypothetical protein